MSGENCWDVLQCGLIDCPAYNSQNPCWLVSGTIFEGQTQDNYLKKIEVCLSCDHFMKNIQKADLLSILSVVVQAQKSSSTAVTVKTLVAKNNLQTSEFQEAMQDIVEVFKKYKEGALDQRISKIYSDTGIDSGKNLVNEVMDGIDQQITEANNSSMDMALGLADFFEILRQISEGNFQVTAAEDYQTELLTNLGKMVNTTVDKLGELIKKIKEIIVAISSSSIEISSTNEEIINKARQEMKIVTEASSTITELTASINQVANNAEDVYQTTDKSLVSMQNSNTLIKTIVGNMAKITEIVNKTADTLAKVQSDAKRIKEILNMVDRISEKVDLLALNATIEASSVGEAGRRFRVVADEMRKLADNSMKSSEEISSVLMGIQDGIDKADDMMKGNVASILEMGRGLDQTGLIISDTVRTFESTSNLMREVSLQSSQQAKATDMFSNIINQISASAQETVKGIENGKVAVENFIEIAMRLKEMSGTFKIKNQD